NTTTPTTAFVLIGSTESAKSRTRFSLSSAATRWRSRGTATNRADLSTAAETSSFLLWSPTCFWKSGRRAKRGMRPLLAHEVRPCSIYGEAVLEVGRRPASCLYDLRYPAAACACGSLPATNSRYRP